MPSSIPPADDRSAASPWLARLKKGLAATREKLGQQVTGVFSRSPKLDPATIEELENTLLSSDVGVAATEQLLSALRKKGSEFEGKSPAAVLRAALCDMLAPLESPLRIGSQRPFVIMLAGVNGAGKTTTFYMVVGLIKPDEGEVFLNEEEITKLPMYKRAQMGIGYLPQEASVFRKLSVEDNIMAVLEMTNMSKQQRRDRLEGLLEEFNLRHVRKNNGDSLSGGERRRTEIARAGTPRLASEPNWLRPVCKRRTRARLPCENSRPHNPKPQAGH